LTTTMTSFSPSLHSMHSISLKNLATTSTLPKSSVNFDHETPRTMVCKICLLKYPQSEILKVCSESHKFCKNCLEFFLKNRISNFRGLSISCPEDSCTQPFREDVLNVLLDEQSVKLYQQKRREKIIGSNTPMKFCPQAGCSRTYTPSVSKAYTRCKCRTKICNDCGNLWHEDKTCLQAMDVKFDVYSKFNGVKFCLMCKTVVQKIEDHLHITCPVCDYKWCWACGREDNCLHQAVCPKEWKPEPFKIVANEQEIPILESKRGQKFVNILLFIISIPLKLVFFAFAICKLWEIMRDAENILKKIVIFIFGTILSAMYDAILFSLMMEITGLRTGKKNLVLISVLILVLIPYLVYILSQIRNFCSKRIFYNKRWMSRNPNTFRFVASSEVIRETGNLGRQDSPAAVVQIGNILDGIFDDEKELEVARKNVDIGNAENEIFDKGNPSFAGNVASQDDKELSEIKVV